MRFELGHCSFSTLAFSAFSNFGTNLDNQEWRILVMQPSLSFRLAKLFGLGLMSLFLVCLLSEPQFSERASASQSGRPGPFSQLKSVRVCFHTNDDDKDADTRLSINVFRSGNTLVARK